MVGPIEQVLADWQVGKEGMYFFFLFLKWRRRPTRVTGVKGDLLLGRFVGLLCRTESQKKRICPSEKLRIKKESTAGDK